MKYRVYYLVIALLYSSSIIFSQTDKKDFRLAEKTKEKIEKGPDLFATWQYMGKIYVDSVAVDASAGKVRVFLSSNITRIPIREAWIENIRSSIKNELGRRFHSCEVSLFCKGKQLETFVPVYYNEQIPVDSSRMKLREMRTPLVRKADEEIFSDGLSKNNIALWPSHGYYFESELDRWEWQRARLFGTVEDIYPYSVINNFLVPMLEDAGAGVFLPRERDTQTNEVIVDNDGSSEGSEIIVENGAYEWQQTVGNGFAMKDTLFNGDNPFKLGTCLRLNVSQDSLGRIVYVPDIPESGEYAVYVSWAKEEGALDNVPCKVSHSGGSTRFFLNQQMGFGTWVYLGTFYFNKGKNAGAGSVEIESPQAASGVITADAVRFGGGMGNVARRPERSYIKRKWSLNDTRRENIEIERNDSVQYKYKLSGKPRWMEAGRYWLQYAGIPDSIVYNLHDNKNDYNDDYQSRGEWVDYLMGNPNGPTKNPEAPGLNIPVDLAFAFHTDAGITPGDSVIGTLGIYSTVTNDGVFPDGKSKLASRDLTDIIQSQIVSDIRLTFKDDWTRRAMWNKQYSEAWRPNVPTMLLELLSHQNFADMKYGLDPRFQFTVARAIYKGMVRFLAAREGRKAIIKPLAPDHLSVERLGGCRVKISWQAVEDPLEATAMPTGYKVYQRVEDNGFDNGRFTSDTSLVVELPEYNTVYSFKVAALNKGGRSFPGETLSVSLNPSSNDLILIVNGFDRIAPPAFSEGETAGIASWKDEGVPWFRNMGYTGNQYDYDRSSPWIDDDSPGHGASYADMEGKIIPGNTFDFVVTHGKAIRDAGFSFVSVSDEVFAGKSFDVTPYFAIDMLYGEERCTKGMLNGPETEFEVLTPEVRNKLKEYLEERGNLFISGAYIGTDPEERKDSLGVDFAAKFLHYRWMTDHADNQGKLIVPDQVSSFFQPQLIYNTGYHPHIYKVESPDGLEPVGDGAFRIYRYASNNVCAGVGYSGEYRTVALGFPFETIQSEGERTELMKEILSFFSQK
jgi:hypothetical protein